LIKVPPSKEAQIKKTQNNMLIVDQFSLKNAHLAHEMAGNVAIELNGNEQAQYHMGLAVIFARHMDDSATIDRVMEKMKGANLELPDWVPEG